MTPAMLVTITERFSLRRVHTLNPPHPARPAGSQRELSRQQAWGRPSTFT